MFKTNSSSWLGGNACSALLGALTALTLLLFIFQRGQGLEGTAVFLQREVATRYEVDSTNATLHSVMQTSQVASANKIEADKLSEVHTALQGLKDKLTSLPDALKEAILSAHAKAPTPTSQWPAPTKGSSSLEIVPLCSRLNSIFPKPPPLIDLPTYEDNQNVQDPTAFMRLRLANASVAAGNNVRNYSIYLFEAMDVVSDHVLHVGGFEPLVYMNVLKELYRFAKENGLRNEDVYFIDIGGNLGSIALPVAAHGFSVIAFEPMFINQMALRLSVCSNEGMADRFTIIRKGLGAVPSQCTIFSIPNNVGNGFVRCGAAADAEIEGVRRGNMEIVRLDDELKALIPQLKGRLGAVKMDVEGFEGLVVQGGTNVMRELSPPFVVAECDDAMMATAAGKPTGSREFLGKMSELGYAVSVLKQDANIWEEVPGPAINNFSCGHLATAFFSKGKPTNVA